jgi:hypothetical protein
MDASHGSVKRLVDVKNGGISREPLAPWVRSQVSRVCSVGPEGNESPFETEVRFSLLTHVHI